jgi:glycosyltransferase involved in cell wall biosynthesis
LKAESPEQVVSDLAGAMGLLAENSALRQRMGEAARARVRDEFRWEPRALAMCEIYRQALAERPSQALRLSLGARQNEGL